MVVLRGKTRYQCGHSSRYSGFKLAKNTFMLSIHVYVVVQVSSLCEFYFPLLLFTVMYDNEYETRKNKIQTKKKKIKPQL